MSWKISKIGWTDTLVLTYMHTHTHTHTHPPTHSPTHSHMHSLHSLTQITHTLTKYSWGTHVQNSLDSLTHSLRSLIQLNTLTLILKMTHKLTHSLTHSLTHMSHIQTSSHWHSNWDANIYSNTPSPLTWVQADTFKECTITVTIFGTSRREHTSKFDRYFSLTSMISSLQRHVFFQAACYIHWQAPWWHDVRTHELQNLLPCVRYSCELQCKPAYM